MMHIVETITTSRCAPKAEPVTSRNNATKYGLSLRGRPTIKAEEANPASSEEIDESLSKTMRKKSSSYCRILSAVRWKPVTTVALFAWIILAAAGVPVALQVQGRCR